MARLLPPESAAVEVVSREVGVSVDTLEERWRAQAMAQSIQQRSLDSGAAQFEAVLTTAAMDEATKHAWCCEHGVYRRISPLGGRVPPGHWPSLQRHAPRHSRLSMTSTASRSSSASRDARTKPWRKRLRC